MTTPPAVLLLMSPATYRAGAFARAAEASQIPLLRAIDTPPSVTTTGPDTLGVDLTNPDSAVQRIVAHAQAHPVSAILAIDDQGALVAARASARLGLPHNDPSAALAARDKFVMREALAAAGVPVPAYQRVPATIDPATIAHEIAYPCVVKPLLLNGSRGVIRADDPATFTAAFARTVAVIEAAGMPPKDHFVLIEAFVPGIEVALEGLLTDGELETLALFDKPDPLDGPYFEETIYVTPSRLPAALQAAISRRTAEAAAAIGLRTGPVHAELRIDREGEGDEIWLIELAGRSIGGLCSSVLEFGTGLSLEELILRHAAGSALGSTARTGGAAGVMMIPIPRGGMLRAVEGQDAAAAVPGVTGIEITAPLNQPIAPLPEGESYLGFIFASGATPAAAEVALREAHGRLTIRIEPILPLRPA